MDRVILHSDINSCYASIEHLCHPELDGLPLAVAGSVEMRHGIILAKDELAKRCGIATGMTVYQAKSLCPELNLLPPRLDYYIDFSRCVKQIYLEYTDMCESFGIDESWLDLSGCVAHRDGQLAAREINRRVKRELGITVSVGVSWNKVFAKLGSDYKKPDAVTAITRDNFRDIVWPLPVSALLYIGRATTARLKSVGISTIGQLAVSDPEMLKLKLGKMGYTIHAYANGLDDSPVLRKDQLPPLKSISNSVTAPRDLVCDEDARVSLLSLTESVAMRLRRTGLRCRVVSVAVRGADLSWRSHQHALERPTEITREIFQCAMALFSQLHVWPAPVHSIGICLSGLETAAPEQLDLFGISRQREKQRRLDTAMDNMRDKYGFHSLRRGLTALSPELEGPGAPHSQTLFGP